MLLIKIAVYRVVLLKRYKDLGRGQWYWHLHSRIYKATAHCRSGKTWFLTNMCMPYILESDVNKYFFLKFWYHCIVCVWRELSFARWFYNCDFSCIGIIICFAHVRFYNAFRLLFLRILGLVVHIYSTRANIFFCSICSAELKKNGNEKIASLAFLFSFPRAMSIARCFWLQFLRFRRLKSEPVFFVKWVQCLALMRRSNQ